MKKIVYFGRTDITAVPVSIFSTRRVMYSGSIVGMFLSTIFIIALLSFCSYKYTRQQLLDDDVYFS